MLAGGGMTTGQVIGETNRFAEEPVSRPIHFQEVVATLYHNLGIDPHTTITDLNGRPHYLTHTTSPTLPHRILRTNPRAHLTKCHS